MAVFYIMLIVGTFSTLMAVILFGFMLVEKNFTLLNIVKTAGALLLGVFLLVITLPSLKYILLEEYDVIGGDCTIDITSSGRSTEVTLEMLDTGDAFIFFGIPALDAYGKSIPYYCEVIFTQDHEFEMGYKIYDVSSRELMVTGK
ncbi:hypothetical protein [Sporosarcina sp. G11-34]|uniref:hypothetical protein n=1 Tax=Sporosarcina sp. G11-34 TaxID=2849605 RepID=UPI0022A8E03B|nr:hypothetical protein [Sporosarcina sp. G11-34]MCZ2260953.1 hypothetical protein [Sporosarcina sp. G11-34]